jgi:hypothetical protein
MDNLGKREKLFDTIQLARAIYMKNVSDFHTLSKLGESASAAQAAILLAEIWLLEQEKYAKQSDPIQS